MEPGIVIRLLDGLAQLDPMTARLVILFVLGLCGLGLPMPEDVVLLVAGYLAHLGKFSVWEAVAGGIAGVLMGDAVLFFFGHHVGRGVLRWPRVQAFFGAERLAAARHQIVRRGHFICFVARFLPGLRSPLYLVAGAMGVPPRTYVLQDGIAASLSVPLWVGIGYAFGGEVEAALRAARQVEVALVGVVAVAVLWQAVAWWRRRSALKAP